VGNLIRNAQASILQLYHQVKYQKEKRETTMLAAYDSIASSSSSKFPLKPPPSVPSQANFTLFDVATDVSPLQDAFNSFSSQFHESRLLDDSVNLAAHLDTASSAASSSSAGNTLVKSQSYQHFPSLSTQMVGWIGCAAAVLEPGTVRFSESLRSDSYLEELISRLLTPNPGQIQKHPLLEGIISALRSIKLLRVSAPIVSRAMSVSEMESILTFSRSIPLAENSSFVSHVTNLLKKSATWKAEVKAVMCLKGPVAPAPLEALLRAARRIPVILQEDELRLEAVLNDNGRPWCVCRGLTDGFMVSCDKCSEWFHGGCVGVSEGDSKAAEENGLEFSFNCPGCCQKEGSKYPFAARMLSVQRAKAISGGIPDINESLALFLVSQLPKPPPHLLPPPPPPSPPLDSSVPSITAVDGTCGGGESLHFEEEDSEDAVALTDSTPQSLLFPVDFLNAFAPQTVEGGGSGLGSGEFDGMGADLGEGLQREGEDTMEGETDQLRVGRTLNSRGSVSTRKRRLKTKESH